MHIMELAEPSIAQGFADCVESGADEVIAFPYMLSPGRHSTRDIPRMIREAAAGHPGVRFRVTPAFGMHEMLAAVVLSRAGLRRSGKPRSTGGRPVGMRAVGRVTAGRRAPHHRLRQRAPPLSLALGLRQNDEGGRPVSPSSEAWESSGWHGARDPSRP